MPIPAKPRATQSVAGTGLRRRVDRCLAWLVLGLWWSAGPSFPTDIPFPFMHTVANPFGRPESTASADIDADGDMDLLAARSNSVTCWMNLDGRGTNWLPQVVTSNLVGVISVVAADLDHDGDLDVLGAANAVSGSDRVAWLENLGGAGTNWFDHTIDGNFNGASSAFSGDVDGDGDLDVLGAAVAAHAMAWWENLGGLGTNWSKHFVATNFNGASSVFGADVDGDGDLDVLGAANVDNDITWWENVGGSGSNWVEHTVDGNFAGSVSVSAGDVDGDGDIDVVGAGDPMVGTDLIDWWENLGGKGTNWATHIVAPNFNGAHAVYLADLDADGDLDVLGVAQVADDVTWFENVGGGGTTWVPHTVNGNFDGARAVVAADLDRDGDADVAATAFIANDLSWWENKTIHRSAAFCTEFNVDTAFEGAQSVFAVDMDKDGDLDLLGAGATNNRVSWWENAGGSGAVWLERDVDNSVPAAWSVVAADVDGDGDPDVLGAARDADRIAWWENTGGNGLSWTLHPVASNLVQAQAVAAVDMDHDGDSDILAAGFAEGVITWWENKNRTGTNWIAHQVTGGFSGATAVAAADIDRDGKPDVVGAAGGLGRITWWRDQDGSGTNWQERVVDGAFAGAQAVTAVDLDRDGDLDLLGAAYDLDRITWWENVGGAGTNWTAHLVDTNVDGASDVCAVDLDLDGDPDVVGGGRLDKTFSWWENLDGSGTNWSRHVLGAGVLAATACRTADLDGDGDADVIGAAGNASGGSQEDVFWWRNDGGQFALLMTNTAPPLMLQGSTNSILTLTFVDRGRPEDNEEEWAELSLLFEESPGDPLSSSEANNLVQDLKIYLDTGSGQFESGSDTLVASIEDLNLSAGIHTVTLADSNSLVQFSLGTSRTYFVVASLTANAGNQSPYRFQVTPRPDTVAAGFGPAEDRIFDLALTRECDTNAILSDITAIDRADVAVSKSGLPNPLVLDSNITYTITVTNRSVDNALNVVVTDGVPALVSFNAAGSSPDCLVTNGVVVCHLGTVGGLQSKTVTVAMAVQAGATGALTNRAEATTLSIDSNLLDNVSAAVILLPDSDLDGSADYQDPDDDNDGMSDQFEINYGLNRTNAADAVQDADSDTFLNLQEYIADTDPHNNGSYFRMEQIAYSNLVVVYFESSAARVYTLQYTPDVNSNSWNDVAGRVDEPGSGFEDLLVDFTATNSRFYRLQVKLP